MLEIRPPLPAQARPAPTPRSRPHAQRPADAAGSLAAIHVLLLAWLAHLLTLADLQAALCRVLSPRPAETAPTEPDAEHRLAAALHRELLAILRILYVIGARPARGMRALPSSVPTPRRTPPIRPPPDRVRSPAPAPRFPAPLDAAAHPRPRDPEKDTPTRHHPA